MPRKGEKRAPHRLDCQCAICVKARGKAAREATIGLEVEQIPLDNLKTASLFDLKGERYRVAEKTPECIVCHKLRQHDVGPLPTDKGWQVIQTVSLATFTIVMPIK